MENYRRTLLRFVCGAVLALTVGLPAYSAGLKDTSYTDTEGKENWDHTFDISARKPGTYNIVVEGKDAAGNVTLAGPINIYVDPDSDLPIVSIANPLELMRVGGDLNIVGTCIDDDAVGKVELSIDGGEWVAAVGKDFWSFYVKAGDIPDGRRVIKARGVDINGLVGPERQVTFNMDKNKPLATVTSHNPATLVAGKVELKGGVYDANGVQKVEFSLDGGKTYLATKGSFDKKTATWNFSAPFDSRTLQDGPTAILIRAVDGVGSIGITPFMMVVDNTKPTVELVSPAADAAVDGAFTLFGIAGDAVGLSSASWSIGKLGGDIPLTPGDPYWTVPVTISLLKEKEIELVIRAKDTIGNVSEIKRKIRVDLEKDRPVVTILSPVASTVGAGSVLLSGSARDDDAVKAIEYTLDKQAPVKVDSTGSFAVTLTGLSQGAHSISVKAFDLNGTAGPAASVSFNDQGGVPALRFAGYQSGGKADPFAPGRELAPNAGSAIQIVTTGGAPLSSIKWKIAGLEGNLTPKGAGEQSYLVPVPANGPYGLLPVEVSIADTVGRTATASSFIYVTNFSQIRGDPGFVFNDERIDDKGFVRFGAERRPLVGRFIGARLAKLTIEPAAKFFKASFDGSIVTVEATDEGASGPHVLVATTDRGHQFRSNPFTFTSDARGPELALDLPPAVVGTSVTISGQSQDASGVSSVRWALGDVGGALSSAAGKFSSKADLSAVADGALLLQVIARDTGGNETVKYLSVCKDTKGPDFTILSPRSDAPSPLVAGFVRDSGSGLSKVLFAEDGSTFRELDPKEAFNFPAQASSPSTARLKAIDRAGNTTVIPLDGLAAPVDVAFAAADPKAVPQVQVLSPSGSADASTILMLRITAPRALSSVDWTVGTAKGHLDPGQLTPMGNCFMAAVSLEGYQAKPGPVAIAVTVKDSAGKSATAKSSFNLDPAQGQASVTVLSPAEGAAVDASVDLAFTGFSRSGIASFAVSVDGAGPQSFDNAAGGFQRLEGLSAGAHAVSITPRDSQGREGPPVKRSFRVTGAAPVASIASFTRKTGSDPFSLAGPQVLAEATSLDGSVKAANGLASVSVTFADRPAVSATLRKNTETDYGFSAPIPLDLPFDRIPVRIEMKDNAGRVGELKSLFFRVSAPSPESEALDAEGLRGYDTRVLAGQGPDGSNLVRLYDGETLTLRFTGRPLVSAIVDDKDGLVSASFDGPFVTIKGEKEGLGRKTAIKVKTADGDEFSWGPVAFVVDRGVPQFDLVEPKDDGWYSDSFPIAGTWSDPNGIAAVRWSLDGQTWTDVSFDAPAAPAPAKGSRAAAKVEAPADGPKSAKIPLAAVPDGALVIQFRVEDKAGRVAELRRSFNKDATPPEGKIVLPRETDKVNGRTTSGAMFRDNGELTTLEFSEDAGKTWIPADRLPTQTRTVDFSALGPQGKLTYRARDKAGNVAEAQPLFTVDYEADKPRTVIQLPGDNEVLRADYAISGAVYDDDGAAKLFWRVDGSPWTEIPVTGSSFSIPFTLAASLDNEHLFEAYAVDMYGVKGDISSRKYRISKEDPKAQMNVPALDQTVRGIIEISGESSDKNGIKGLELSFDNAVAFNTTIGAEKWSYRLDTTNLKDGLHSIYIRPTDKYDSEGFFATLISIDNTPPDIKLDVPLDGIISDNQLRLSGRVSDDRLLASCEAIVFSRGSATVEKRFPLGLEPVIDTALDITGLPDGEYGVRIVARDKAGNETLSSRDFVHKAGWKNEGIYIATPVRGEHVNGLFRIQGHLHSSEAPASIAILVDGKEVAPATLDRFGWFCLDLDPATLKDGPVNLQAQFKTADGRLVASEKLDVEWHRQGPWIATDSFTGGAFIPARPWLSGRVGFVADPILPEPVVEDPAKPLDEKARAEALKAAEKKALAAEKEARKGREVVLVEISLDNGRTFREVGDDEKWKFRLQTQEYPEGPLPLVLRATFRNGAVSVSKVLLNLDKTPPIVTLLKPAEGGRFNEKFQAFGTASDDVELTSVRIALRDGDKSSYKLPGFIQGLFVETGFMGDTLWDVGAGLTFLDDNIKLEGLYGNTPENYQSVDQRFFGAVYSAKLLANIVTFPCGWAFGPDWDWLSANIAVGAKFSYFTETASGDPLMLSAVVAQLEFPKVTLKDFVMFSDYSFYMEYQAWFISAEINGGVESRFSLGLRTSVF